MSQVSMSASKGSWAPKHNTNLEYRAGLDNVNPARSQENVILVDRSIKQVYHELFDDALERYNAKQSRPERRIEDYYQKIKSGKQELVAHEFVIQIGNKDTNPATDVENRIGWLAIYRNFSNRFEERFPNLRIVQSVIHQDEATPHSHLSVVPFVTGSTRGLDTRNTFDGAMKQMGFEGKDAYKKMQTAIVELLEEVSAEHGIERLDMGCHRAHVNVHDFKAMAQSLNIPDIDPAVMRLISEQQIQLNVCNEMFKETLEATTAAQRATEARLSMDECMDALRAASANPGLLSQNLKDAVAEVLKVYRQMNPPDKAFLQGVQNRLRTVYERVQETYTTVKEWIAARFAPVSNPVKVDTPNQIAYTKEWKQPAPEHRLPIEKRRPLKEQIAEIEAKRAERKSEENTNEPVKLNDKVHEVKSLEEEGREMREAARALSDNTFTHRGRSR